MHVVDVHAEDAGAGAEGQEDDGHGGEGVNSVFFWRSNEWILGGDLEAELERAKGVLEGTRDL